VTPHGVELTINKIYDTIDTGKLSDGQYEKPERTEAKKVMKTETNSTKRSRFYALSKGGYVIEYDNIIEIPENHMGLVFPRSRVVRSNANITTGIWDAGYRGGGEGGLMVNEKLYIKPSMPIAVLVMCEANTNNIYDGSHNNENIDE
jgi:Deoxycytidine deaminase